MDVPKEIYLALKEIRISSKKLESLSLSTRVVQDLGIYGDDFDDFYELLAQNYQSSEKFDPIYCPDEFAWTKQLILWLPFVSVKNTLNVPLLHSKKFTMS